MTVFLLLIAFIIFYSPFILLGMNKPEVIETVYSFDNKNLMVLEERGSGALGGDVYVYAGRNIDFGFLGRYLPVKVKYYGGWGERPYLSFVNNRLISINGEVIGIEGRDYLSNNELDMEHIESRDLMGESAEGGRITRYKNENGHIPQYKVVLYGETGRIEENYYFTEDSAIYYTRLEEMYSAPISQEDTDILSKTLKEGIIANGQLHYGGQSKAGSGKDGGGVNLYKNLEELNSAFDKAY